MLPVTDGGPDHVDNYLYALGGSFNMSISNKFDCFNCYMAGLIKAEKAVAVALRVAASPSSDGGRGGGDEGGRDGRAQGALRGL